jgi:SulP family sulfate permease
MSDGAPPRRAPSPGRRLPIDLAPFRPCAVDALRGYDRAAFARDLGAGLTVGVVALPLAMAFAIASGVKPEQGLITAIVAGFLVSALGGSRVQIAGPAGAFIVIVYGIVQRHGLANLLIATAMAGVLLFLMGLLRLGALVRFIPVAIVIGFTNGIAVLIALSQVKDLLGLRIDKLPADFFAQVGVLAQALPTFDPVSLAVGLACLAVVVGWPKSYTMPVLPEGGRAPWTAHLRRWASKVPGTVVALGGATAATTLFGLPLETIGSRFGGLPQTLPAPSLPAFSWEGVKQLVTPTLTIALLGAIESLLCARVADNMSATVSAASGRPPPPRHDPNQELMAQGVANIVSPLFGGMPVTGTIARTVTNIRAGAATPVAGLVHAATILAAVLFAAPLAEDVPLAALAGILLFVAWNMGEWREFARLRRFRLPYRTVLLGTFLLTVVFDLTVAVEVGLALACVFFIVRMGSLFRAELQADPPAAPGVQLVALHGALFFGAVDKVEALESQVKPGTHTVVFDLRRLVSLDTSGLEALDHLVAALQRRGLVIRLAEADPQPLSLLERGGLLARIGAGQLHPTLTQALAAAAAPGPARDPS